MPTAAHVVFVDDEPMVLSGLRRALSRYPRDWRVDYVGSGVDALETIEASVAERRPVDVLVTDYRMPGMDGLALLQAAETISPATARVVLSGQADRDSVLTALRPTHMFLSKPCDVESLVAVLDRLLRIRALVQDPELRSVLGATTALPKAPRTYYELQRLAADPATGLDSLVGVIEGDPALTAEILKLTNSAFFGLADPITDIHRAVGLLGLDLVQGLAAAGALFAQPSGPATEPGEPHRNQFMAGFLAELRAHALSATRIVRRIAAHESWDSQLTSAASLACMLHDVGWLAVAAVAPEHLDHDPVHRDPDGDEARFATDAVTDVVLGIPVGRASALLLATWGFPADVVDTLLLAVEAADTQGPATTPAASRTLPARAVAFARSCVAGVGTAAEAAGAEDGWSDLARGVLEPAVEAPA